MGQQQLLLLVLGIVIVGLAVVIGIQAFNENQTNSTMDAMVSEAVRLGSDLQAWSLKPQAFGGPVPGEGFTGIAFADIGYPTETVDGNDSYVSLTASWFMGTGTPTCAVVGGISNDGVTSGALNGNPKSTFVSVKVTGARPENIETKLGEPYLTC